MGLSEFALKLFFLFLPGIISLLIIDTLTVHRKWEKFTFSLYSFVLGLLNYLLWYPISCIEYFNERNYNFLLGISKSSDINIEGIIVVTAFVSIPLGLLLTWIINSKLIFKIARKIKISEKIDDLDIWDYVFTTVKDTEWILIRDYENDRVYEGWVKAFSQTSEKNVNEVFMIDVQVYVNSTAEPLYTTPGMYFSCRRENVIVEFPNLKS